MQRRLRDLHQVVELSTQAHGQNKQAGENQIFCTFCFTFHTTNKRQPALHFEWSKITAGCTRQGGASCVQSVLLDSYPDERFLFEIVHPDGLGRPDRPSVVHNIRAQQGRPLLFRQTMLCSFWGGSRCNVSFPLDVFAKNATQQRFLWPAPLALHLVVLAPLLRRALLGRQAAHQNQCWAHSSFWPRCSNKKHPDFYIPRQLMKVTPVNPSTQMNMAKMISSFCRAARRFSIAAGNRLCTKSHTFRSNAVPSPSLKHTSKGVRVESNVVLN